jgi:hypothetical protein
MVICKLCGKECRDFKGLSSHLSRAHKISSKEYYDTYLKKDGEGVCKCGKETVFENINIGYRIYCSASCSAKYSKNERLITRRNRSAEQIEKEKEKRRQNSLKKWGTESPNQSAEVRSKQAVTLQKNYGVSNPMKSGAIKDRLAESNKARYGHKNIFQYAETKSKTAATMQSRYGVAHPLQSKEILDRFKTSMLRNFGVENPMQSKPLKDKFKASCIRKTGFDNPMLSPPTKEKAVKTLENRYGCSNPMQNAEFRSKASHTLKERTGYTHPMQVPFVKEQIRASSFARWQKEFADLGIELESAKNIAPLGEIQFRFKCKRCGNLVEESYSLAYTDRVSRGKSPCTRCFPVEFSSSIEEENLSNFVASVIGNENIVRHDRITLNGKELDILIPSRNVAIEYNGLYWHSTANERIDKEFHLQKTVMCEAKGIRLIHVFSDEYAHKQEIVESRIKSILGKSNTRIMARKCSIANLSSEEANNFIEENHLQGANLGASFRIGLKYGEMLVACMTFGISRFNPREYELLRYCSTKDTNVIGGAGKLLACFEKNKPAGIDTLVSYADRRWSNGGLYRALGFSLDSVSSPSYSYVTGNCQVRENRMKFQKAKLLKHGADPKKTEKLIMEENGYSRVYDCGNLKFVKLI